MNQPMLVFLDTDIGPDCDDAAALAILLQLCREGYANIVGITHCTGSPYGLGTIDAICREFDVQVPLGTCNNPDFLSDGSALSYTPTVCARFANGYPPDKSQPDAVDAFVRAMEGATENSVTMITIGPLNNLARYLTEPRARSLMDRCVRRIVMMAGSFVGDMVEWNVQMDVKAMQTVVNEWKKGLILCPFEAAVDVPAGAPLALYPDNPVKTAYILHNNGNLTRSAWDLVTVACAVLEETEPFTMSAPGILTVSDTGLTRLSENATGNCSIIRKNGTAEQARVWIDTMLDRALKTMTSQK